MRTTIISAQITTVEDKIAGNLNLTQIILLCIPIFASPLLYMYLLPSMKFSWYKVVLLTCIALPSVVLSIRIKGKIMLEWFAVLVRYTIRPRFYVFDKNDTTCRELDLPNPCLTDAKSNSCVLVKRKQKLVKKAYKAESYSLDELLQQPGMSLQLIPLQKGGIHVALRQAEN